MSIYLRGNVWYCYITHGKQKIRHSLETGDRAIAESLESAIRASLVAQDSKLMDSPGFNASICYSRIKERARRLRVRCDLEVEDIKRIYAASNGRCALSSIPFDCSRQAGHHKAPFSPSIDRIDPCKGYVKGNVRFVCLMINIAMNEWGQQAFDRLAHAYIMRRHVIENASNWTHQGHAIT